MDDMSTILRVNRTRTEYILLLIDHGLFVQQESKQLTSRIANKKYLTNLFFL